MAYPLAVAIDDELALLQYLRGVPALTALIPAARITLQLPPNPTYPAVLLQRSGGDAVASGWMRLDWAAYQVDVLGPTDRAACKQLAQTVRAAIKAIANDTVSAGVLVSAAEEVPPQWMPDTLSNPPLPRFTARYRILLHP